jgi:SAM-dependent methyltransferase
LHPLPADGPVLAYEEHSQFLYALGDASIAVRPSQPGEQRSGKPAFVRRFIHLKPGVFVVDDFVGPSVAGPLRWRLGLRSEPKAAGRQLRLTAGDQQLVCETLWPAAKALQSLAAVRDADESIHPFESVQESGAKGARWLHVFQLQPTSEGEATAACSLEDKDGEFALTITASQRVFRLTLPPPAAEAGWIAIEDASGKTLVPRRPFAAGVLPHGPEGTKLLERWDSAYRAGGQPGWDTGIVAPALKQAVESGAIKPCRTVDLGCGSGTNAIYLASQGFDVTGIDVAPTALGIAADKAAKAGVRVRWVLADVLALPELEPFDLVFDRGCYHNVRYVDAAGFVASLRQLTHPGTRCLILSCNRDGPPGVREHHMRSDFSALFDFEWLRDSGVESRDGTVRRESWSLMLRRKPE